MIVTHVNLAKGFRGGERQTALLIEQLSKNKSMTQKLVCRKDSPLRESLSGVQQLSFVDANYAFLGHCKSRRSDVIHAHDAKAVHWAWLHNRIYKTPYLLTRRIDKPVRDKWLNRKTYKNAAKRVGVSKFIANLLSERQWGECEVIHDAYAELESKAQITSKLRDSFGKQFLVGHIGALVDKHKGQRVLIQVAERISNTHPDIHFLFYGEGEDGLAFKQESKHLKNVHWQGFSHEIGSIIPMLDLFVFPSRMEGLGSTLLDVMYFNVPIIASNVGGIPDVVQHGKTGILFENGNVDILAKNILDLYSDDEKRVALARTAKLEIERFSPKKMAQLYLAMYHQILDGSSCD